MRNEMKVTIEKAARILGTDVDTIMNGISEVGIRVHRDMGTGFKYISESDFEELKESLGFASH